VKVKLDLNIGSVDARRLGLTRTLAGSVVDVSDDVGRELLANLWAREATAKDADAAPDDADQPDLAPLGAAPAAPRLRTSAQLPPDRGVVHPGAIGTGVPPAPGTAGAPASPTPDLESMTKADLVALAAERGIDGVDMGMTKAEIITAIEDALTS
jgi:hypothetical protein